MLNHGTPHMEMGCLGRRVAEGCRLPGLPDAVDVAGLEADAVTLAGAFPRDTIHVGPTGGWYAVRDLGEERAVAVRPVPGTTEDPFVALRALRATQRGTEMAEGCEVRPARGMYSCCALPVQVCGTCDAPTPCDCTDAMVAAAAMLRRGRLVVGGKVLVPSKYIDKGLVHSTQNGAGTE